MALAWSTLEATKPGMGVGGELVVVGPIFGNMAGGCNSCNWFVTYNTDWL